MKKADSILFLLWCVVIPSILALFALFVSLSAFDAIYIEMELDQTSALLNAMSLIAVMYITGWMANLTWGLVHAAIKKSRSKRLTQATREEDERNLKG